MGYIALEFEVVNYYVELYKGLNNKSDSDIEMLELGDQEFWGSLVNKIGYKVAKDYFKARGIKHTSIDIDNKNGALPIDMREPFPQKFINHFDIITNSGTTEHIESNQWEAFENFHKALKTGGFFCSFVPKTEAHDRGHCPYFYNQDFFRNIAVHQGYRIWHIGESFYPAADHGYLIYAVLQKLIDEPFSISKDLFYSNLFRQ